MTQKDESPKASEGPAYWSEELLAVLVVGLGDELLTAQEAYLKNNAGRKPQGWKVGDFAANRRTSRRRTTRPQTHHRRRHGNSKFRF